MHFPHHQHHAARDVVAQRRIVHRVALAEPNATTPLTSDALRTHTGACISLLASASTTQVRLSVVTHTPWITVNTYANVATVFGVTNKVARAAHLPVFADVV